MDQAIPHLSPQALRTNDDLRDVTSAFAEPPEIDWLANEADRGLRPLTTPEARLKRALDVLTATGLIIATSPLLLTAMLAVAVTSRGPVIYTQTRVGLNRRRQPDRRRSFAGPPPGTVERRSPANPDRRAARAYGRPFTIYKLRTMCVDAERAGAQWATKRDPRVTAVGRLLRKTRIDELPQLWNVLKGDMSIVGPRPERPEFIAELSHHVPGYLDRLGIKPGLTGLAQVVNGYDDGIDSVRRKVHLDLLYLRHFSLWTDLKILLRTVSVVLTGSGAH